MSPPTICLTMIVKNESKIIKRLLEYVLPIIDTYVICDTGSDDDTPNIIKIFFEDKKISGDIVHLPFKNFGYNRSYVLEKARGKATYALLLDADMELIIDSNFNKSSLTDDGYYINVFGGNVTYWLTCILTLSKPILSIGVTHEYYDITGLKMGKLKTLSINHIGDGGCKIDKFERDILLLQEGLRENPTNSRYWFYLANSYFNIAKYEECIPCYIKHIEIATWVEEIFQSHLNLGIAYKKLNRKEMAISTWLNGYNKHPKRSETIYEVCKLYREDCKYELAQIFYNIGVKIPFPLNDILFIQKDVYTYLFAYELSIFGYYTGTSCTQDYMDLLNIIPDHLYDNVLSALIIMSQLLGAR